MERLDDRGIACFAGQCLPVTDFVQPDYPEERAGAPAAPPAEAFDSMAADRFCFAGICDHRVVPDEDALLAIIEPSTPSPRDGRGAGDCGADGCLAATETLGSTLAAMGARFGVPVTLSPSRWDSYPIRRGAQRPEHLREALGTLLSDFDHYLLENEDGSIHVHVLGVSGPLPAGATAAAPTGAAHGSNNDAATLQARLSQLSTGGPYCFGGQCVDVHEESGERGRFNGFVPPPVDDDSGAERGSLWGPIDAPEPTFDLAM